MWAEYKKKIYFYINKLNEIQLFIMLGSNQTMNVLKCPENLKHWKCCN